jgi:hypothetical protein
MVERLAGPVNHGENGSSLRRIGSFVSCLRMWSKSRSRKPPPTSMMPPVFGSRTDNSIVKQGARGSGPIRGLAWLASAGLTIAARDGIDDLFDE